MSDEIKNLEKAKKLFQYLYDNFSDSDDLKKELEEEIRICNDKLNNIERKNKLEIHFKRNKIFINTKKEIKQETKRYPLLLTEQLILNERLHWIRGFIYLPRWTESENVIKDPKKQFDNYFAKAKWLIDYGFDIKQNDEEDVWKFNYETTKSRIDCNLFDALDNFNKAETYFEQGNIEEAITELEKSISPLYYGDVYYINAYKLLLRCLKTKEFKNISSKILKKVNIFLGWYNLRINNVVDVLNKIYKPKGVISGTIIEDEFDNLRKEKEEINNYYKELVKQIPSFNIENERREIEILIEDVLKIAEIDFDVSGKITSNTYQTPEFEDLKKNQYIQEVYNQIDPLYALKDPDLAREDRMNLISFKIAKILHNTNRIKLASKDQAYISPIFQKFKFPGEIRDYLIKELKTFKTP